MSKFRYYPSQGDANFQVGIGDRDGTWRVVGFMRNTFEASEIYQPQYDFNQPGITQLEARDNNFRRYGVRFEYFYQ